MASTSSVFLNVRDIRKSIDTYKTLGFRVKHEAKDEDGELGWADLELDGAELSLGSIGSNDDPEYREWVSTPLGAGVIVYFTVRDADKFFERAKKAGVTIESPVTDRPYGRIFTMNDPDGYVVSFIQERRAPARRKKAAARGVTAKKSTKKAAKKAPKRAGATKSAKKATKKAAKKTTTRKATRRAPR